ncbi:glycerol-3-phosphate 1-O-acyltransferase PlsY [Sphingomonas sp.]|uniref:glycerol-3-phosphate 1-O-acyltransferase PlsY n=1 Tax=Sphingomonas sp. TaxID=28214 RepID=UPI00286AFB3F|nr:glycerol-3-phosphate 1-O-acyltransferase PlsY [Sphingomonas sp.]
MLTLAAFLLGYALGSIPFGLIVTRLAGKGDIRDIGSGNIGATNVLRTGSKKLAALTLLLDAAKGALAVIAAAWAFGLPAIPYAATGALLGHLYPVWLRFRGGKGVATLLGILIPLLPFAALVYALVWLGLLLVARISSLAGMIAAASAPLTAYLVGRIDLFPMLLGFALLVIWKHRANIARLRSGTEPRVGQKAV